VYSVHFIRTVPFLATLFVLGFTGCKEQASQAPDNDNLLKKTPTKYWSDSPKSIKRVDQTTESQPSKEGVEPAKSVAKRVIPQRPPGPCSVEKIQAIVRPHRDEVVRCYRKAVYKNPSLRGRLVVEMHIDKAGSARFLGVTEDKLGDEDVTRCIFGVLKKLAYPIPEKNSCAVLYPFVFSAGPPS